MYVFADRLPRLYRHSDVRNCSLMASAGTWASARLAGSDKCLSTERRRIDRLDHRPRLRVIRKKAISSVLTHFAVNILDAVGCDSALSAWPFGRKTKLDRFALDGSGDSERKRRVSPKVTLQNVAHRERQTHTPVLAVTTDGGTKMLTMCFSTTGKRSDSNLHGVARRGERDDRCYCYISDV